VAGIYGVVSQSVSQRSNEIGIRVALGASKSSLLRMIVGEALLLISLGAIAGAFAGYQVSPLTYLAVAVLLSLSASLASVIPARRATGYE